MGRVQTPTLAMICQRYLENKNFTAVAYWQHKLNISNDGESFGVLSVEKYDVHDNANNDKEQIHQQGHVVVQSVEEKTIRQEPPLLYDLTTLQKEANTKYGFSADKTLTIAQKLYESKYITYPRTGSRYLSQDVFETIPELIKSLCSNPLFKDYALILADVESLNKNSVNDKKITDHHAIIITENQIHNLSSDENTLYTMIAGRMLESFSEVCVKDQVIAVFDAVGHLFTTKGAVIKQMGWRSVFNDVANKEETEEQSLPALKQGDLWKIDSIEVLEKQTKAKPLHSESSLLSAMETCGKELEEQEQRQAMKECGLGTPATRAAIIETLFKREYIIREKKSLVPTNKGLSVYSAIREKRIADVALTGQWESTLLSIESQKMAAETFEKSIQIYTEQITKELLSVCIENTDNQPQITCPKCKEGKVRFYPKIVKCSDANCDFKIFREICTKKLSDKDLISLLTQSKNPLIKGMKGKSGKSFDARIKLKEDFTIEFIFEKTTKKR